MSTIEFPSTRAADTARPPAWQNLEPTQEHPHKVCGNWADYLVQAVGREGHVYGQSPYECRSENYYRFITDSGNRQLFLKTIAHDRVDSQWQANRIADWLERHQVRVSTLLEGYPRRLDNKYFLLAYTAIDSRFAHLTEVDLRNLGRLLGRAHSVLSELPWRTEIAQRSVERDQMFVSLQTKLVEQAQGQIRQIIEQSNTQLDDACPQVIHGDLNIGNVLFALNIQQPILLDFEDANHNWHSPLVDLAMLLERFVLVRSSDEATLHKLSHALLQGYREQNSRSLTPAISPVALLQALSCRALLLLGNTQQCHSQQAETAKFIYLHALAEKRRGLLESLWDKL